MIGWVTIWEIIWSGGLPHLTGLPHLPWSSLPPCKQVHRDAFPGIYILLTKNRSEDLSLSSSLSSLLSIVAWISVVIFLPNIFVGVAVHFNFIYLELKIFCLLKEKSLNQILQLKRVIIYFVVAYICFIRITNNSFSIQIFNHMYWK